MQRTVNLVFPHQLFEKNPLLEKEGIFYIVEEYLFFKQYTFHKQKLAFHRASMQAYKGWLETSDKQVEYIEAQDKYSDIRKLLPHLAKNGVMKINYVHVDDDWLEMRISRFGKTLNIHALPTPLFINTLSELKPFFNKGKKKYFQTAFYKSERLKRNILLNSDKTPTGGKWTYDTENRLKWPKGKVAPDIQYPKTNDYYIEAVQYVEKHFNNNLGSLTDYPLYPFQFESCKQWFRDFLSQRFHEFGPYEDAIVQEESILNHSVLSPMINVGLLPPKYIVEESLGYATANNIPLNSLEGFIRQLIGWREFIRGIYLVKGAEERTRNFWGFKRKIPNSFYDGTTGIPPVDSVIKKVLKTGYCHHIERLMVLGNFMLLCEFDPDEVYRWFMELFIDAYDWVMVPNTYGMSQFADGGLMSTKPYISGSNYLMKMSNYKKGEWQQIWDGLFWRFMHIHRNFFLKNPRLGMLIRSFDRMSEAKQNAHLKRAEQYLIQLVH